VACENVGNCMNNNTIGGSAGVCKWNRKVCVTCRSEYGFTLIRVQTNSYPNHCFKAPVQPPKENLLDFEVAF